MTESSGWNFRLTALKGSETRVTDSTIDVYKRQSLEAVGQTPVVTGDPAVLRRADKLFLPGVGAVSYTHLLEMASWWEPEKAAKTK